MSDPRDSPTRAHATTGKALEILARYISSKGLRSTRQRDFIVEVFFDSPGHVTVDDVFRRVQAHDKRIGAATVYRTMRLLVECGLASARQFGDGQTRYEPAIDRHHHDHLICTRC